MYCEGCLGRVLSRCYQAILPHIFLISIISINCLLPLKLVIDFVHPGLWKMNNHKQPSRKHWCLHCAVLRYLWCLLVYHRVRAVPGCVRRLPEGSGDEPAWEAGPGTQLRSGALPTTAGHIQREQHGRYHCRQLLWGAGHQPSVPG